MAVIEIPLDNSDPSFDLSTELDSITFNFVFRWNGRIESWVFDLLDSEKNPIQTGNPFIVGFELLKQNVRAGRPPGSLYARNHAQPGINPNRFNIGSDVKLYYVEQETVEALNG